LQTFFANFCAGVILTCTAASITGCSDNRRQLAVTGASTVAPILGEIAKRYESLHPGVRIDVQTGGTSRGIRDARSGLAHIGMVSRALKEEETDLIPFTIAKAASVPRGTLIESGPREPQARAP
jgi:phosphate transport system substrate-binding protein